MSSDGENEYRPYSLTELKELQNKLMLITVTQDDRENGITNYVEVNIIALIAVSIFPDLAFIQVLRGYLLGRRTFNERSFISLKGCEEIFFFFLQKYNFSLVDCFGSKKKQEKKHASHEIQSWLSAY